MSAIDEVKSKVDIVEIVSQYIPLKKAGRNLTGLCPFHGEKNPSFFVFPGRQSWHCFGACNTGGDVFSFLMKKENLEFGEVLRILAEKAGVVLVQRTRDEGDEETKSHLFELNEISAEYFHHLLGSSAEAKAARAYLEKRGLSNETIRNFQLGFSLDSWDGLCNYLTTKGYNMEAPGATGLTVEKESGGGYDRFRNRLMFPIRDVRGRVMGFGGRVLDDSLPKYLNTPQTPVFDKGGVLYGIDRARGAIRSKDCAILVEGYMDVLMAHQNGWENVVASMGTSITEKQIGIIKRLTRNFMMALDPDAAGEEATLRSMEVLGQSVDRKTVPVPLWSGLVRYENVLDADVKVVALPAGKDPDEIIREDVSLWQGLVEKAQPVLDFALAGISAQFNLKEARGKSQALDKLLPLLYEVKDPVRRSHYLQKSARLLKVEERALESALRNYRADGKARLSQRGISPSAQVTPFPDTPEEYCLTLLLTCPELKGKSIDLRPEYFQQSENRELLDRWLLAEDNESFRNSLDDVMTERVERIIAEASTLVMPHGENQCSLVLEDCVRRLLESWLKRTESDKEEFLRAEAEMGGIPAQLLALEDKGVEGNARLKEVFDRQKQQRHKRGD